MKRRSYALALTYSGTSLRTVDTICSQLSVLYTVVSLSQWWLVHSSMCVDATAAVSFIERCPSFKVSFIERFHCVHSATIHVYLVVCGKL